MSIPELESRFVKPACRNRSSSPADSKIGTNVVMPRNHGAFWLLLAFGLGIAGIASTGEADGATARRLMINPATFAPIPDDATPEPAARGARGLSQEGPRIMLWRPEEDSVFREGEAVTVHVEFLPSADGNAPNMATLQVKVRKGLFGKDITDAVEPYVDGTIVHVPEVDFSGHTGSFRFEIRIRDHRNRATRATFRLKIRP